MKHSIRKQIKDRGIFVEFDIEVSYLVDRHLQVDYYGDTLWRDTCIVGVNIFYEYFQKKNDKGLNVKIISVNWIPVDTNILVVLYGIVSSLSKEINFEIASFGFNAEIECFQFPESRILLR